MRCVFSVPHFRQSGQFSAVVDRTKFVINSLLKQFSAFQRKIQTEDNFKMVNHNCCVPGCKSDSRKSRRYEKYPWMRGVGFLPFPVNAGERRLWIRSVRRPDDWRPTHNSRVCTLHFVQPDTDVRGKKIPSWNHRNPELFPWNDWSVEDELLQVNRAPNKLQASKDIARISGQLAEELVNFHNASLPPNSINASLPPGSINANGGSLSCDTATEGEGSFFYFHDIPGAEEEVYFEEPIITQRVRDFIVEVKVESELVEDRSLLAKDFIVKVKVEPEFEDDSTYQAKDFDLKLKVDPDLADCPRNGEVHPVKSKTFQNNFLRASQDALSHYRVKQEPCDSPPVEPSKDSRLLEGIHPRDDRDRIKYELLEYAVPANFLAHPAHNHKVTRKRKPPKQTTPSADYVSRPRPSKILRSDHNYFASASVLERKTKRNRATTGRPSQLRFAHCVRAEIIAQDFSQKRLNI
uniref:THAP domain-containing protein 1 n=1 Tax=Eptatretus burgeri TaxID=7764 RepID=A0A8C4N645_EPTBU